MFTVTPSLASTVERFCPMELSKLANFELGLIAVQIRPYRPLRRSIVAAVDTSSFACDAAHDDDSAPRLCSHAW